MRSGADRLLARVVQVFGAAQAHHGHLFANARGTRIKLLVHDGFGVWWAARRLNAGPLRVGPGHSTSPIILPLTNAQFDALVLGLPWELLPGIDHHHMGLTATSTLATDSLDVDAISGFQKASTQPIDMPPMNSQQFSAKTACLRVIGAVPRGLGTRAIWIRYHHLLISVLDC